MTTKSRPSNLKFPYTTSHSVEVTMPLLRKTLREVRDQLLSHDINGGKKHLAMDTICDVEAKGRCQTAACIGGWTSIFLLGFEGRTVAEDSIVEKLFSELTDLDHLDGNGLLHDLFYDYPVTSDYDKPNVAATAIQRYLRNQDPWPHGEMPRILPYTNNGARKPPAKKK